MWSGVDVVCRGCVTNLRAWDDELRCQMFSLRAIERRYGSLLTTVFFISRIISGSRVVVFVESYSTLMLILRASPARPSLSSSFCRRYPDDNATLEAPLGAPLAGGNESSTRRSQADMFVGRNLIV